MSCPAGSCCHRQQWRVTKTHLGTLEASNESQPVMYNYMSLDNVMLVLECMWASKPLLEWMDCNKTVRAKRPTSSPLEVFRLRLEVPLGNTLLLPAHKSLLNGRRSMKIFMASAMKEVKLEDLIALLCSKSMKTYVVS